MEQLFQQAKTAIKNSDLPALQRLLSGPRSRELVSMKDGRDQNLLFGLQFVKDESLALTMFELLLQRGANPLQKDKDSQTIMYYFARDARISLLKRAGSFDYNLNELDSNGQTALFYAACYGNSTKAIDLLVSYGCQVNIKDFSGETCLFYAVLSNNVSVVRCLVEHGCNVQTQNNKRERAINKAKQFNKHEVVQYLSELTTISRKQKEEKNKENSQPEGKKKREVIKAEYSLTYTNEEGKVHILTLQELEQFREHYPQLWEWMEHPDQEEIKHTNDRKFEKIAMKILNTMCKLDQNQFFAQPVDYQKLNLHDYTTIIKHPNDFATVRTKLTHNVYENQSHFQEDMNLIFDNCILYNSSNNAIGKVALQMKLQFNVIYAKQFNL